MPWVNRTKDETWTRTDDGRMQAHLTHISSVCCLCSWTDCLQHLNSFTRYANTDKKLFALQNASKKQQMILATIPWKKCRQVLANSENCKLLHYATVHKIKLSSGREKDRDSSLLFTIIMNALLICKKSPVNFFINLNIVDRKYEKASNYIEWACLYMCH